MYTATHLEKLGFDSGAFVHLVKAQLSGQGVPGAHGGFEVQLATSVGAAPAFAAIQNSGQGTTRA